MSTLAVYDCMLLFMYAARPERVRETFQLIERGAVTYCLSAEVVAEIGDVLTRPEHQRRFPALTADAVTAFLEAIVRQAHFVHDVPDVYTVQRDPKDSKYVNLALAAGARYLVTRDNDLLSLMDSATRAAGDFRGRFPDLKIISPADFARALLPQPGSPG